MSKNHEGRVAVVTGAASGIGPTYALRLAEDGADLALADLKSPQDWVAAVEKVGRRAVGQSCDVSDPEQVAAFAAFVEAELGGCDILVNNVGISPYAPFEEITLEEWRKVMTVNLDSLLLMSQAFVPGMRKRSFGRIVNISSGVCWAADTVNMVHYTTSKMGVVGFTRALATEVGDSGITVNAIAPSLVRTPTLEERMPAERFEEVAQGQSIKRVQVPDDLAGVVSFLASEDAGFVTGQTIAVAGGNIRL